jgi:hypothetical protein
MNINDPNIQIENDKKYEAEKADESLKMSNEELLKKIFYSSTAFTELGPNKMTSRTVAYFSSLLVNLSRQAEKSTKKIVRLTWFLFGLTVALLIVAIVQIVMLI